MKNIRKLIILLFMVIIVSGCVKVETNMKISMTKKMDFEIIMALDKDMLKDEDIYKDELLDDKQKEELRNKGFEITKYNDNNQIGNIITKKFDSIDYLSSTEDINYDLNSVISDPLSTAYIFKVEKGFLKNTYTAKYDLNNLDLNVPNNFDIFDLTFKVTLPYKALENNATSINQNGKQLIWDMSKTNDLIEFKFNIYNIKNVIAIILVILIIILFIINRILTFISKDKKQSNNPKKSKKNKETRRFIMVDNSSN